MQNISVMKKYTANCLFGVAIFISFQLSIGFTFQAAQLICPHRINVPSNTLPSSKMTEAQGEDDFVEDYDVTCYVVNDEEIVMEGEKPHVVCTSEPEDVSCTVMFSYQYHFY